MMFLVDIIVEILWWIYNIIYGFVFWVFRGLIYMVTDPEAFFNEYGLLILMIVLLGLTIVILANWFFKRYLFQRVFMAPNDKPRNRRFIGRKLFFLKNGGSISGFFYNYKLPEEEQDKFDGLLYFVYPKMIWKIPIGFSADRILIPKDDNRTTWKLKGGIRWKKDFIIYYKGMKEHHNLASKIASDENKSTVEAVGPDFFMSATKQKINDADTLAQKGVTANAESQQFQLALGSVPHNQGYAEMSERELASVYLKKKEDEDVDPEELSKEKVDNIMKELEVGETSGSA